MKGLTFKTNMATFQKSHEPPGPQTLLVKTLKDWELLQFFIFLRNFRNFDHDSPTDCARESNMALDADFRVLSLKKTTGKLAFEMFSQVTITSQRLPGDVTSPREISNAKVPLV